MADRKIPRIPEALEEIEKIGIREAWNISRSQIEEGDILVVAVPKEIDIAATAEQLRKLLEKLFPDEEGRPLAAIVSEDFKFGYRNDAQFVQDIYLNSPETGERLHILGHTADAGSLVVDCGNESETWRFRTSCTKMSRCSDCGKLVEVPRDGRCDECIKDAYMFFGDGDE